MPDRAAIVTGASSGIGLAIAHVLGEEGYAITAAARRPEKLTAAAEELRGAGFEVEEVAGNMADEDDIKRVVAAHKERFGRLDVLVNNAGVGDRRGGRRARDQARSTCSSRSTCARSSSSTASASRCSRRPGAEHRNALVVNMSSISGKSGQPWLSVYSATKAGVIGYTQAMNQELTGDGIKSVALCPAFVETPMTEFVREQVPADQMIRVEDVAEAVRFVLKTSPNCVIPEIVFQRPGEQL